MSDFDTLIEHCSELLNNFSGAKDVASYIDGRLSKSAQKTFGFGYFPTNENLSLLSSAISDETLNKLSLIYDKVYHNGYEFVRERHSTMEYHNLIMPYRDVYGEIVGIVGRTILDAKSSQSSDISKYKNTDFKKRLHLFGLYNAKQSIIKHNKCYIVEGQFDCISAHDKGMQNVVALGSSGMSIEQVALLLRYTKNFVLLLDNDEAGIRGAEKITEHYAKYANLSTAKLPQDFKDLDEALKELSPEDLEHALK
jgi:DNA primase